MWDAETRARRAAGAEEPTPEPAEVEPDELSALIAGIVAVTLDTRLADCSPTRRAALGRELEARLLAIFAAPPAEPAHDGGEGDGTEHDADHGNGNGDGNGRVATDGAADDSASAAVAPHAPAPLLEFGSPAARALGLVLENRLARLGGTLSERADLRERLIALALQVLDGAPPPSDGPPATPDELRDLDMLQRRAFKLERSLEEARAALAYVSGLEHVDEGLASIYRSVQGIELADPQRGRKQEALEGIFRANLELQRRNADG